MENVVVAIVIVILLLFAILTLTGAVFDAQATTAAAWEEAVTRMDEQTHTALSALAATSADGMTIQWVIENSGSIPLADYDRWDVLLHYYDTFGAYHVNYVQYSAILTADHWTVTQLLVGSGTPEIYNRGILDPSERAQIDIPLVFAIQPDTVVHLTAVPANGAAISTQFVYMEG